MTQAASLSVIDSLVIGILQGLAEFLPISSSAHIIIYSEWVNGVALPLALNVGLHGGTLLAVLSYFWADLAKMLKTALEPGPFADYFRRNRLNFALLVGTIPAAVVGLTSKDQIELLFHHARSVIIPLVIVGWLIWWIDRRSETRFHHLSQVGMHQAILIGLGQALALIPGVSRSGATITMARYLGFDRDTAARFSFLLGVPAMLGALVLQGGDIGPSLSDPSFYWGFFGALITGFLTIHFFLKLMKRIDFLYFAIYRTCLGLILYIIF
jgi:undecaprenyl-diphosphatase